MIQNQVPLYKTKNPYNSNLISFENNKRVNQSFGESSYLEKKQNKDTLNNRAAIKKQLTILGVGLGILASTAVVVGALIHKKVSSLEKSVENLKNNKAPDIDGKISALETIIKDIPGNTKTLLTPKVEAPKTPEGLNIKGNTFLKLNKEGNISDATVAKIKNEIQSSLDGDFQMKEYDKTNLWSVSYEGWGGFAGGQHDVANELPTAIKAEGIDTVVIAPLLKVKDKKDPKAGFSLTAIEGQADKFLYKTHSPLPGGSKEVVVTKIYDEAMNGSEDKLQVFHAKVGPKQMDVLFVHDGRLFDLKEVEKFSNIYDNVPHSDHKTRVAQFSNLTYELLMKAKEGKIKIDGKAIEAPNKMLAHEAWQSGALLQKMKLFSYVEEEHNLRGEKTKELTSYARELANNTSVIIHNVNDSYQGWAESYDKEKPFKQMEDYFNLLHGKYAHKMVESSVIDDLRGTDLERVGFVGDWMNAAHSGITLASKIGSVSEGYTKELTEKGLGSRLTDLIKIKYQNGGLISFPNGLDKSIESASKDCVDRINNKLKDFGRKERIQHYLEKYTDKINPDNKTEVAKFLKAKSANKKVFLTLLKEDLKNYKTLQSNPDAKVPKSILFNKDALQGFYGDYNHVDLNDIDPNKADEITIYSMASRLDKQKGFDTAADALVKLAKTWNTNPETKGKEKPIFLFSGSGDAEIEKYLAKTMERLHNIDPDFAKRVLFTKDRLSPQGLLLTNMTTRNIMPSDFEPYGISDGKGLYAGTHVITTGVGGTNPSGSISRKIYNYDDDPKIANAMVMKDYEYMCTAQNRDVARKRNAVKFADMIVKDINLPKDHIIRMDVNALNTDVSWNKGAVKNYFDVMKIKPAQKQTPKAKKVISKIKSTTKTNKSTTTNTTTTNKPKKKAGKK